MASTNPPGFHRECKMSLKPPRLGLLILRDTVLKCKLYSGDHIYVTVIQICQANAKFGRQMRKNKGPK